MISPGFEGREILNCYTPISYGGKTAGFESSSKLFKPAAACAGLLGTIGGVGLSVFGVCGFTFLADSIANNDSSRSFYEKFVSLVEGNEAFNDQLARSSIFLVGGSALALLGGYVFYKATVTQKEKTPNLITHDVQTDGISPRKKLYESWENPSTYSDSDEPSRKPTVRERLVVPNLDLSKIHQGEDTRREPFSEPNTYRMDLIQDDRIETTRPGAGRTDKRDIDDQIMHEVRKRIQELRREKRELKEQFVVVEELDRKLIAKEKDFNRRSRVISEREDSLKAEKTNVALEARQLEIREYEISQQIQKLELAQVRQNRREEELSSLEREREEYIEGKRSIEEEKEALRRALNQIRKERGKLEGDAEFFSREEEELREDRHRIREDERVLNKRKLDFNEQYEQKKNELRLISELEKQGRLEELAYHLGIDL